MDPIMVGILGIVLLVVLLFAGIPVAFSLGITGFIGLIILTSLGQSLHYMASYLFGHISGYTLIVVPLFIFMGHLAFAARISEDIYSVAHKWLGQLRGSLAIATIAGAAGFAATCGSSTATAAAIGKVSLPEMEKYGYDMKLATGAVSAGGLLGIMIPPSVPLVLYGILTQESIGKMLMAGIIPGILTAVIFSVGIFLLCKRNPKLAGKAPVFSWGERLGSLKGIFSVLILFLIVMGGIYSGFFTATEAAAVGASVALVMVLIRSKRRLKDLREAFLGATTTTCMIMLIIGCAAIFTIFIGLTGIPARISEAIVALPIPRMATLALILAIYLPLGMFLDGISILYLTVPIMFPAIRALGFSGIVFGILVVKMIEVGLLTPPVGINVYVVKGIAHGVSLEDVFRGVAWFVVMEFVALVIIVAFPVLCTWIPNLMIR